MLGKYTFPKQATRAKVPHPTRDLTPLPLFSCRCGDGIWAMDVARSYPKWIVVGMDDMDGGPPPIRRFAPRNFKFIRCHDTLLESLKNIQSDSFDLVHCRFLAMSYTAEQYQQLVKECWRVCKPGGFVELLEMDMRIYYCRALVGQVTQTFNSEGKLCITCNTDGGDWNYIIVIHAMESKSLDPRIARRFKDILSEAAALQNDNEEHRTIYQGGYISLPLGVWGGRLGVMFRDNVRELFEQFQPTIAEFKQTDARSDNELEDAFEHMDHEMEAQEAFMNLHHAFAQKLWRCCQAFLFSSLSSLSIYISPLSLCFLLSFFFRCPLYSITDHNKQQQQLYSMYIYIITSISHVSYTLSVLLIQLYPKKVLLYLCEIPKLVFACDHGLNGLKLEHFGPTLNTTFRGFAPSLLQEQSHSSKGYISCPLS